MNIRLGKPIPLMDESKQPTPKWDPGTVVRGCSEIYRLDRFVSMGDDKQSEIWDFTDMRTGESLSGGEFPYTLYAIHRLPHEFKVGDCFECDGFCQHNSGYCKGGTLDVKALTHDGMPFDQYGICHDPQHCSHCPSPKEEKPAYQPLREDQRRALGLEKEEKPSQESPSPLQSVIDECVGKREFRGDCIFECTGTIKDGLRWKRVLSKDQLDDAISRAVETSEKVDPCIHGVIEMACPFCCPENFRRPDPFQGPHWDEPYTNLDDPDWTRDIATQIVNSYQRDKDLRDELRRVREELK